MRYELKEMGLGDILDVAVRLFRDHFKVLFTISCYLAIPFGLVHGLVIYFLTPQLGPNTPPAEIAAVALTFAVVNFAFTLVVLILINPVTNAATIHALSLEYLGKPVSASESLKFAFGRLWPILKTTALATILILLGLLALVIPGIILAFRYWFTTHVVVIEDINGSAALKRSRFLMKTNMGKAFVLGILLAIIAIMVQAGSGFVPVRILSVVVAVLLQTGVFIFGAAAGVVFYFSSRCQHENFDLTVLAGAVGEEAAQLDVDATA